MAGARAQQWAMIRPDVPELTPWDQCQHPGCDAQAFVRVVLMQGRSWVDLDFCAHHHASHEIALMGCERVLGCVDARNKINKRPFRRMT